MQKVFYYIRAIYRVIDKIMYFVGLAGSGHVSFSHINNRRVTIEPINPSTLLLSPPFPPHLLFPDNTTHPRRDVEHNNAKGGRLGRDESTTTTRVGMGHSSGPSPKQVLFFFVKQILIN